ncbi:MAG: peptidoglycan editing factor PgeF [Burkholderiaceae bacterium]
MNAGLRSLSLLPVRGAPWEGVRYGTTTRHGGVSHGPWASFNLGLHTGDDPEAVKENRRRLAVDLPAAPFWLEQVHGTVVADADADVAFRPMQPPPRADAAITMQPGRVLAIMTADCAPVVIADLQGRALGMAHAGWRGLAGGVLEATVSALRDRLPAAVWRAWVGPCIGQARFEVGDEVRQAFVATDPSASRYFALGATEGKWQADLAALARHRLDMLDVYSVETSGYCTHDMADLFHSYRRSSVTGRMATLAWLEAKD